MDAATLVSAGDERLLMTVVVRGASERVESMPTTTAPPSAMLATMTRAHFSFSRMAALLKLPQPRFIIGWEPQAPVRQVLNVCQIGSVVTCRKRAISLVAK